MTLHAYKGEVDWVVAESPEEAAILAQELYGPSSDPEGHDTPGHWTQVADDKPLAILDTEDPKGPKTTKTCAEWIASNGRGLLCTTEW